MEHSQLPPELEQLERRLADGPRLDPSSALRQRVLRGVHAELASDGLLPRWRFAAAAAAAVFIWLSLSLAITQMINSALARPRSQQPVGELARQIQRRLPELSPEESLREAILLQVGAEFGSLSSLRDRLCLDASGGLMDTRRSAPQGSNDPQPQTPPPRGEQRPAEREGNPQSNGILTAGESQYV